ncbi:MAG: hypothetical protein H6645_13530, partial [Caldilineaceae bacterium]|nr:hypothetical protein [Caldilineaceae bacterium]
MYAKYHIETTAWVLQRNFSPRALKQVIEANLAQDSIKDLFLSSDSYRHFCNDTITTGLDYVEEQHRLIEQLAGL